MPCRQAPSVITPALQKQTNDPRSLARLLMKLCEKTGRRLRHANYSAQGVHVAMVYIDLSWWHTGRKFDVPVYTTQCKSAPKWDPT
jgi:hypothetical protein